MITFLNGSFVDEREAKVPVSDRGFLYGDGLFETLRIYTGTPFRLKVHWERLERGAAFLKINVPYSFEVIQKLIHQLIEQNGNSDAVLRITLSRGAGHRGYSIKGANSPTFAISLHPLPAKIPPSIKLQTPNIRIPKNDPLSSFKTANKLHHILAKTEAEEHGADEALMLNSAGGVAQVSSGNIFWTKDGTVYTPPIEGGILPGITRTVVMEFLKEADIPVQEAKITKAELSDCEGCFITNSVMEIVPVSHLDGRDLKQSPIISDLQSRYQKLVREETG